MAKKIDTSNLTVDYKQLMRMTVQDRVGMAKSGFGEELMQSLTPTQLALAFPKYYARQLPDIGRIITGGGGGGSAPSYGGAGTSSGGGSTATPAPVAPSGRQNPQPSSNANENTSNAFLDELRKQVQERQQQGTPSADGMTPDKQGYVNPTQFRNSMINKIRSSGLNGFIPPDGERYGIKKGTAEEWANYFTGLAKHESGLKTTTHGDVGSFGGHGSRGLFQLSPQDALTYGIQNKQFTYKQLQDPNLNADVALKIHEHWLLKKKQGIQEGAGKYWGPLINEGWTPGKGRDRTLPWSEWSNQDATGILPTNPSTSQSANTTELRKDVEGGTSSSYDTWPKPLRDYLDNNPNAKKEALTVASTGVNVVDIYNTVYARNPKLFDKYPNATATLVRNITNTPPGEIPQIPDGEFRERVIESQADATRRFPLNENVKDAINYSLHQAEKNLPSGSRLEFNVISGGQDKEGQKKLESTNRHNHGLAGDGDVYIIDKDNKKRQLRSNSADDRAIVASISRHFSEVMPGAGIGGFSPDTKYMGGNRIHIGGPNQPGGPSTTWNASAETEAARAQGTKIQNENIKNKRDPLKEWKDKREAAAAAVAAPVAATQIQQGQAPVPAGAVAVKPQGQPNLGASIVPLRGDIDPAPAPPPAVAPAAPAAVAQPAPAPPVADRSFIAYAGATPTPTAVPAAPAAPAAPAVPAAPAAPAVPAVPQKQMAYGDAGRLPPTGKEPIQLSSNGKVLADVSPGEMIKAPKANGSGKGEVVPERRIDDIRTEVQNDPRNMEQQEQPQQSNQPMAAMTSSQQQQPQQNMNNDQKYAELMNSTYDKPGSMDSAYRMSRLQSNPTRGNLDVGNTGHNTLT